MGAAAPAATPRGNFQGGGGAPGRGGAAPNAAFAEHHGGAAPTQFNSGHFYGRDYGHFTPHEMTLWHEGRWHHEFFDGRYGWWYEVDGIWYFYDQPIYPYPTYIPDIVYVPDVEPDYVAAPPPPAPGQPYYYYYCDDAQAYYPYVATCSSPWREVPAVPQQ